MGNVKPLGEAAKMSLLYAHIPAMRVMRSLLRQNSMIKQAFNLAEN